jgi:hypothetical protein
MSKISQNITNYLNAAKVGIQKNMRTNGLNATGETSRSIATVSKPNAGNWQLVASEVLEKQETGTPPKSKGGVVFFDDIVVWLAAKRLWDLSPYAVTNKIAALGTTTYQKGGRTDIYTPELEKFDSKEFTDSVQNGLHDDIFGLIDAIDNRK